LAFAAAFALDDVHQFLDRRCGGVSFKGDRAVDVAAASRSKVTVPFSVATADR
jgi:hypothetical protein